MTIPVSTPIPEVGVCLDCENPLDPTVVRPAGCDLCFECWKADTKRVFPDHPWIEKEDWPLAIIVAIVVFLLFLFSR
jgi:hypothetical protein